MTNTKLTANGYSLSVWWALPNAFANPANPTVAELNATDSITDSIAWDSFSFGTNASNQNSDPTFIDVGNTQSRGFSQFGGSISFMYPFNYTDTSNGYYTTFLNFVVPRTLGYLIFRIDGQKTTSSAPDAAKIGIAGDFLRIYKVQSDAWADSVTGENNFKYAVTFQPQGNLWINAVLGTVTVVTPVAIGTPNYVSGSSGKTPLGTYVTGRQLEAQAAITNGYPGWFSWSTSDASKATIDANGVLRAVAAGSVSVIATHKQSGVASSALAVTIT